MIQYHILLRLKKKARVVSENINLHGRYCRYTGCRRSSADSRILWINVERIYDVGVSGIHRLISRLDVIQSANCVVAVAGMEGALASVLGGFVDKPVIAVPTSVAMEPICMVCRLYLP